MPPISLTAAKTLAWYIRAVQQIGFPILVAGILLWVILKDVPGNAAAAARDVATIRAELSAHISESRSAAQRITLAQAEQTIRLARIMQQICVNTATTTQDRERCFPP